MAFEMALCWDHETNGVVAVLFVKPKARIAQMLLKYNFWPASKRGSTSSRYQRCLACDDLGESPQEYYVANQKKYANLTPPMQRETSHG